jgi:dihydrofolate synthase/folylpolyglutamate synthase
MTYPETVEFLYQIGNELKHASFGLDRILNVAERLGRPDRLCRILHIAGTNGKGSTAAIAAEGLRAAGFRTGLYTSPHLVEPTERIQIDRRPVSRDEFLRLFLEVRAANPDPSQHTTYFETLTLMAFLAFRDAGCEWTVIETGMGGRLDASNIVDPALTVITPISFDHMQYLGHTLSAIAAEKAGILKPGVPAVFSPQPAEASELLRQRAAELRCPVVELPAAHDVIHDAEGTRFRTLGLDFHCRLPGAFQLDNARTALAALRALELPDHALQSGVAQARWPGRIEIVHRDPLVILDGAHNESGAAALADYLRAFVPQPIHLLFGIMRDKEIQAIGNLLFPLARSVTLTRPDNARSADPAAIAPKDARVIPAAPAALEQLLASTPPTDAIVICGSLYLVGELRPLLVKDPSC